MKKRIIGLLLGIIMITSMAGCGAEVEEVGPDTKSMFALVEEAYLWKVVYHKDTKIMYAVSDGDYNHGTFTLLVDENGNPLLYQD